MAALPAGPPKVFICFDILKRRQSERSPSLGVGSCSLALPDAPQGQMQTYAAFMYSIHTMADAWSAYGIMQMVVTIGLISR